MDKSTGTSEESPGGTHGRAEGKGYIFPKKSGSRFATFSGSLGRAGVIGLHPLSGLLVGGAAGYFLREYFGAGWIFWVLLLLGFIAGCRNAYREARALLREQDNELKRS